MQRERHDNGGNEIIPWSLLLSDSVQHPNSYLKTKDFTRTFNMFLLIAKIMDGGVSMCGLILIKYRFSKNPCVSNINFVNLNTFSHSLRSPASSLDQCPDRPSKKEDVCTVCNIWKFLMRCKNISCAEPGRVVDRIWHSLMFPKILYNKCNRLFAYRFFGKSSLTFLIKSFQIVERRKIHNEL